MAIYRYNYYKDRYDKNRELLDSLKDVPCSDCGQRFPSVCMDFDHLPGKPKVKPVGSMMLSSEKKILEEVAKCDVVCSNCHRIRTHNRRKG